MVSVRYLLLLLCSCVLLTSLETSVFARPRNALSTNPVRYGILHFQLDYERTLTDSWGAFVAPIAFHHATWYPIAPTEDTVANGQGIDFGARYYLSGQAGGLFAGPLFAAYRGNIKAAGEIVLEGYIVSLGAQVGYTKNLGRWLLSAGVGPTYGLASKESEEAELPHAGFWLNFRANVGVRF